MEDQQQPKRQNTNSTPPRNGEQSSVVSPPSIVKISSADGSLPRQSTQQEIDALIASLEADNNIPSPLRQDVAVGNQQPNSSVVYLTYVRVGNGNMYLVWATNKNEQHDGFVPFGLMDLPFQKTKEAETFRKDMGCQCTFVNRRSEEKETKVLKASEKKSLVGRQCFPGIKPINPMKNSSKRL